MTATTAILALAVALVLDHVVGEPRARLHPVVWMGGYLRCVGDALAPAAEMGDRDLGAFWRGALAWCGGAALFAGAGWVLQALVLQAMVLPWGAVVSGVLIGVLLKPTLSWRMLREEVQAVEAALAESLEAGRLRLSWLVSRDVSALSEEEVRESAIESLAENLNDSVVAPIFWFVLAGLPGAVLYRFANTADAMWGYRGMRGGRCWEWAGKWAARADDVLSWVPARITGALVFWLAPGRRAATFGGLRAQAALTASPNSGWPMAAMALALGVRLRKPGVYALHADGRAPGVEDTRRAVALAWRVVAACALASLAASFALSWSARP